MFEIHTRLWGHSTIDFDKRPIRNALRRAGRLVLKTAKKLTGKRQGGGRTYKVWGDLIHQASASGEAPAMISGTLRGSLHSEASRSGWMVKIGPRLKKSFYALMVSTGTQNMDARGFIEDAATPHEAAIQKMLREALQDSLVPR